MPRYHALFSIFFGPWNIFGKANKSNKTKLNMRLNKFRSEWNSYIGSVWGKILFNIGLNPKTNLLPVIML